MASTSTYALWYSTRSWRPRTTVRLSQRCAMLRAYHGCPPPPPLAPADRPPPGGPAGLWCLVCGMRCSMSQVMASSCVAAPLHGCCKSTLDSAKCPGSVGGELVGAMDCAMIPRKHTRIQDSSYVHTWTPAVTPPTRQIHARAVIIAVISTSPLQVTPQRLLQPLPRLAHAAFRVTGSNILPSVLPSCPSSRATRKV